MEAVRELSGGQVTFGMTSAFLLYQVATIMWSANPRPVTDKKDKVKGDLQALAPSEAGRTQQGGSVGKRRGGLVGGVFVAVYDLNNSNAKITVDLFSFSSP